MLVTRPRLPSLNLDLVEVEGGGSCPTQFFGRTADGRPTHIRYRGGSLSVERGPVGGSHSGSAGEWETLLDEHIGPYLHGDVLLEQVCDLTGITVRGRRPELSEEARRKAADEAWILDWSGRTTYLERQLHTSEQGAQHFVDRVTERCGEVCILEIEWSKDLTKRRCVRRRSVFECGQQATLVFDGSEAALNTILASDNVRIQDLEAAFAHAALFRLMRPFKPRRPVQELSADQARIRRLNEALDERFSEQLGRTVVFADAMSGNVRTSFATESEEGQRFITGMIETADACFFNKVEMIDLRTDKVTNRPDWWVWFSRDLAEWCGDAPERYLTGTTGENDLERLLGVRPAPRTGA